MTIAFYKVDNSLHYERHTFDNIYDKPQEILAMLQKLPEEEVKFYDTSHYDWSAKTPNLADFEEDFNDEMLDNGWWCVMVQEPKQTLESMISADAYNEIVDQIKEKVGEDIFNIIFPSIKKALEEGPRKVREQILSQWLNISSCRVCSHCGSIMEEGWYLDWHGYACSDECCMAIMNVDKEEFDRYSIFKPEIEEFLTDEGKDRKIEDLTEEEIKEITSGIIDGLDAYYYTEWY